MAQDDILISFKSDLASFRKELDEVKTGIKGVGKAVEKTGKETNQVFEGIGNQVNRVGTYIAGAFAVGAIINFTKEAVNLAKQAEGIERAFVQLNKPDLLSELRKATKGAVSDVNLMKGAVKANNFKIPLEQLGSLFAFAAQRARDTGENVDFLTESIVLGISRKSIPIIDNLGISATEVQNEFQKTGDFAKAVANIIEVEMGKSGASLESFAEKSDRVAASFDNVKTSFGKFVITATDSIFDLDDISGFLNNMNKIIADDSIPLFDKLASLVSRTAEDMAANQANYNEKLKITNQTLKQTRVTDEQGRLVIIARMKEQQKVLYDLAKVEEVGSDKFELYTSLWNDLGKSIEYTATRPLQTLKDEGKKGAETIGSLTIEMEALVQAQQNLSKGALLDQTNKEIKAIQAKIKALQGVEEKEEAIKKLTDVDTIKPRTLGDLQSDRLKQIDVENKAIEDKNKELNTQLNSADTLARVEQANKEIAIKEDTYQKEIDLNKKKLDQETADALKQQEDIRTGTLQIAHALADAYGEIIRRRNETEYNDKLTALDKEQQATLNFRGTTEQQKAAINAQYDAKRKKILTEQFEANKRAAIIQTNIAGALAVVEALPNYILAAAVGVTTGIQLGLIASQPTPKFHTGGVDINPRNKQRNGEFSATLIEGESVIHAKATKKWKQDLEAMNGMKYEDFVVNKYIVPALRKQQEEIMRQSSISNFAQSIALNGGKFNDGNIVQWLNVVNRTSKENAKVISKALGNQRKYARSV